MAVFNDEDRPVLPPGPHAIGQDLATLSIEDIESRITMLREEILRLEDTMRAKTAQRSAADLLFRGQQPQGD